MALEALAEFVQLRKRRRLIGHDVGGAPAQVDVLSQHLDDRGMVDGAMARPGRQHHCLFHLEMVLGADIVIAAEHARFGLPEAKVGRLPLDGGMVMLQRLIPRNIAAGLMMTGRMLGAAEAARLGLVNAVVPEAELDAEVERWVADVVACAPLSLKAIKRSIRATAHLASADARGLKTPELVAALTSADSQEGVAAFREKRAPQWTGR